METTPAETTTSRINHGAAARRTETGGHQGAPTRDVEGRLLRDPRQRPVVVRPPDLQRLALENDAVEGHGLGRLVHRAKLHVKGHKVKL